MLFDDWDLITDEGHDMDVTDHTRAPFQVSSLTAPSKPTSGDLLPAAPKSRPLPRPDIHVQPRFRAPMQLNSQRNFKECGESSHATFLMFHSFNMLNLYSDLR